MTAALSFYYHVELGGYLHQLFWTEIHRADFVEMFLHHIITISLITASYLTNYTRIGVSIMLIHDLSDIFLEVAKVFNYTSKVKEFKWWAKNLCDLFFVTFAIVFFVTRLMIYPRYILYSVIVEGVEQFGCEFGGCYVFIGLLSALQCLHIFWFYTIFVMLYRVVTTGIEKDERSDDDEVIEESGNDHAHHE